MSEWNIYELIDTLIDYGMEKGLCKDVDRVYVRNQLLHLLHEEGWQNSSRRMPYENVSDILEVLDQIAIDRGIIQDSVKRKDAFDSLLMNTMMPRPSELVHEFFERYKVSSKKATDYYYGLALHSHYIREERIQKNIQYKSITPYGVMDMTINLSKPEKDPKDIAAALNSADSCYPSCAICKENEGYYGNAKWDGRSNHRLIPLLLSDQKWYLQYSPYVYYNEHCIVLNDRHEPMKISHHTFENLFAFVKQFPHYFIGSNADLPIVGGSILSHDHYQGGCYTFAMTKAKSVSVYDCFDYLGVKMERLYWPLTVFRLSCQDCMPLIQAADTLLEVWRQYSDESVEVLARTDRPHNTITPIARYRNGRYELDIVLRNNRTSEEHPLGIFHPHEEVHPVKKENIGLIEVMGLAVLPARLQRQIEMIKSYLLHEKEDFEGIEEHEEWVLKFEKLHDFTKYNVESLVRQEVADMFVKGLEHCGVFKWDKQGDAACVRFIQTLKKEREN